MIKIRYFWDYFFMCKERWKQLTEYHPRYWVSNFGRVKSIYKYRPERVLKNYITKFGYRRVQLRLLKDGFKNIFIHVLVAQKFIKNPKNKPFVNHKDSVRNNCFYKNLEWSTRSENYLHGHKFGYMSNKGERNPRAIINEKQALAIYKSNLPHKKLANMYGLTERGVQKIKYRETWTHLVV